ncbi:MAG: hypothetical protein MJ117_02800 [Lachnospiraceae bacterium]|nr:hypothetical protein [Lachnospiraceae bacterium]
MIIGFDVDNVLVDQAAYQLKYGVPYFAKKGMELVNPDGFDIEDMFACSHAEREKFWTKYIWKYCLTEPMTEGAAELSQKLHETGHKIIIVTGRAHTTETGTTGSLFRWMLKHWLKKNHFYYDEIFYCSESGSSDEKYKICKEQSIQLLIDDKTENLLALKDEIQIICFPAPWNRDCRELDPFRVDTMNEVGKRIEEIEHKTIR